MKHIIVIASIALLGCAEHSQKPTPSNQDTSLHTTVSGRNIADISRDIQGWHDMQHADCKFVTVVGAEVTKREPEGIVEHWTIEACKREQFTYRVLIIHGNGGITDMVSNVDGSAVMHAKP